MCRLKIYLFSFYTKCPFVTLISVRLINPGAEGRGGVYPVYLLGKRLPLAVSTLAEGGFPMAPLYTVCQAATLLQFQPWTVRQWVRAGKLGAVKLGGEWRTREQDLTAFIEAALPNPERQSCNPSLPA
jgi:excisionase family DNA binding protein